MCSRHRSLPSRDAVVSALIALLVDETAKVREAALEATEPIFENNVAWCAAVAALMVKHNNEVARKIGFELYNKNIYDCKDTPLQLCRR